MHTFDFIREIFQSLDFQYLVFLPAFPYQSFKETSFFFYQKSLSFKKMTTQSFNVRFTQFILRKKVENLACINLEKSNLLKNCFMPLRENSSLQGKRLWLILKIFNFSNFDDFINFLNFAHLLMPTSFLKQLSITVRYNPFSTHANFSNNQYFIHPYTYTVCAYHQVRMINFTKIVAYILNGSSLNNFQIFKEFSFDQSTECIIFLECSKNIKYWIKQAENVDSVTFTPKSRLKTNAYLFP